MNVIEALQALKDRKKMRRSWWDKGSYVEMKCDGTLRNNNASLTDISVGNITNDDWELYTEPLKLTPEEIKALKLARDCGFDIVYRNKYDSNGVAVAVKSEPVSYWFVGYAPSLSCLEYSDWITKEPMSINDLLKDEV